MPSSHNVPWSLDYQAACNGMMIENGYHRNDSPVFSYAELRAMGDAQRDGVTVEDFVSQVVAARRARALSVVPKAFRTGRPNG